MTNNASERHEGHKVQLWVSDELYAALKARAVRHDTNVSEELRKAASAGLDPLNGLDTIQDLLTNLKQFTKLHLEPLAFVAAMDSAYDAASWHRLWGTTAAGKNPQDLEVLEHQLREQATKRLQRKLRVPDEGCPESGKEE